MKKDLSVPVLTFTLMPNWQNEYWHYIYKRFSIQSPTQTQLINHYLFFKQGMLPHKLVDTAMGGMLMDYLKYLRFRVEQINKQRGRWDSQESSWCTLIFDWTFIAISPTPQTTAFLKKNFFYHLWKKKKKKSKKKKIIKMPPKTKLNTNKK